MTKADAITYVRNVTHLLSSLLVAGQLVFELVNRTKRFCTRSDSLITLEQITSRLHSETAAPAIAERQENSLLLTTYVYRRKHLAEC